MQLIAIGVLSYIKNRIDNPKRKYILYIILYTRYIMAKDPVCNMMVDEKKAQHISEANGQKIYLCSAQCKSQFDQNPSKYGY